MVFAQPDRIPSLLTKLSTLADLSQLTAAAGYTPDLTWLPAEGWLEETPPTRAAVIGRRGGFEWLGFEAPSDPAGLAGRLARRLERGARLAGIMVLCPTSRQLAVSVSMAPRPVLAVHLGQPTPLALAALERLACPGQETTLGLAAEVSRSLDVESTGRRFFSTFRQTLQRATATLPAAMPAADRHAVALLYLTRVLFLYFVQAKGWLDGRPAFLRDELDRVLSRGGDPHRDLLQPLFFGTLNQPVARRGTLARAFGRIPFLNGGLFEPHPLEREWRLTLPPPFWQAAFDELFERFHFTAREGEGAEVAPDMLGRVFEGVMDADERHATGTFYTPAPLVHSLVRAALSAQLGRRLGCGDGEADRRLDDPDTATLGVLEDITILDPACGSGAFLLGALDVLSQARQEHPFPTRQRILARNLFGVDINPAAVRLSELRLWLALVAADTAEDPAEVAPLPNLDSLVRQGDSLLEPLGRGWSGRLSPEMALRLGVLRRELLVATGLAKRDAIRALRAAEREAAEVMVGMATGRNQNELAEMMEAGRSPTLFGDRAGLDWRQKARLRALRQERRFLWSLRRRLGREGELPWFHFQSQFSEVFAMRGGFDLVIGNPPWVRFEDIPPPVRASLAARYRWFTARRRSPGYGHRPDLSLAFLERALELAAPSGTAGFLLPAKVATSAYASASRAALASDATIHCAVDLARDPRATFEATVYPLFLIASNGRPDGHHLVRTRLEPHATAELAQAELGAGPWVLGFQDARHVRNRLLHSMPRLGNRFRVHLGVKTGLNEVYLDPAGPVEPELLRWAVRGRDVRPFTVLPRRRLLYPHDSSGVPLTSLPPGAASYLGAHRERLRRRRDYDGGPFYAVFRTGAASAPCRVVWADLARRLEACALTNGRAADIVALNTCYLVAADGNRAALALASWLNSSWMRALAFLAADPAAGGYRRFNAAVVGGLPLPDSVLEDRRLSDFAVAGSGGSLRQEELDEACTRHLPLSGADRDVLLALAASSGHGRR